MAHIATACNVALYAIQITVFPPTFPTRISIMPEAGILKTFGMDFELHTCTSTLTCFFFSSIIYSICFFEEVLLGFFCLVLAAHACTCLYERPNIFISRWISLASIQNTSGLRYSGVSHLAVLLQVMRAFTDLSGGNLHCI